MGWFYNSKDGTFYDSWKDSQRADAVYDRLDKQNKLIKEQNRLLAEQRCNGDKMEMNKYDSMHYEPKEFDFDESFKDVAVNEMDRLMTKYDDEFDKCGLLFLPIIVSACSKMAFMFGLSLLLLIGIAYLIARFVEILNFLEIATYALPYIIPFTVLSLILYIIGLASTSVLAFLIRPFCKKK